MVKRYQTSQIYNKIMQNRKSYISVEITKIFLIFFLGKFLGLLALAVLIICNIAFNVVPIFLQDHKKSFEVIYIFLYRSCFAIYSFNLPPKVFHITTC